ncbi:hypothetical protein A2U01_0108508, partial [Trifolium medium]|nr:hypothetical protein [Trifolium medium]
NLVVLMLPARCVRTVAQGVTARAPNLGGLDTTTSRSSPPPH